MFDLRPRLVHSLKNRQAFFNANVDLPCAVCGQDVAFAPRVSGVLCGHCGSPLHRQPDDATPVGPTGMLPFRLSEQEAQARLAAAATEPAAAAGAQPPRLRKVYVPYWHLAAHIATSWKVARHGKISVSEAPDGRAAVDYEEAHLAASPDSEGSILKELVPELGAAADTYEPSRLAGIDVLPPTVVLVDAWSALRERWETRLAKQAEDAAGGLRADEEIEFILTEYSNERAAMLLVPVYLPVYATDAAPVSFAIDGFSGDVIRPRPQSAKPDADADAVDAAETPQVPEAFIGGAVLVVIAGVLLLFGLWFAQRLWWY